MRIENEVFKHKEIKKNKKSLLKLDLLFNCKNMFTLD